MTPEKRIERYEVTVHVRGPHLGQPRGISQTAYVGKVDPVSGVFYQEDTVVEPVDVANAVRILGDAVALVRQIDDQGSQIDALNRDVEKYKRERDDERQTRQKARDDLVALQRAVQDEAVKIAGERKQLSTLISAMQARIDELERAGK